MQFILILTYAMIVVFLLAVIVRFLKIQRMPMHLRWELYPVAHEKGKAHYGGSYLEESDWWTKPRETSLLGELKVMIPEILFLHGVWEHNRAYWFKTFCFHFGLYLLVGMIAFLILGGIAGAFGMDVSAQGSGLGVAIHYITVALGYAGLFMALLGTAMLFFTRLFDADYREYTKGVDFFNLTFFGATLVVALIVHLTGDTQFAGLRSYFQCLVTLDLAGEGMAPISGLQNLEILLASLLVAYIPLTHMSHFFTKWFMYHNIRWSDEPNLKGGHFEATIAEQLQSKPTWAAPHVGADGKKNWVDIATSGVEDPKE